MDRVCDRDPRIHFVEQKVQPTEHHLTNNKFKNNKVASSKSKSKSALTLRFPCIEVSKQLYYCQNINNLFNQTTP
jgi:hypothetical protein